MRPARVLAEIARLHPSLLPNSAEHYYRNAMAGAQELGMRPVVAHCHAGLAKLYRRTGKRIASHEHFHTATTMYREMGMTYWLEQTEKESAT